MNPLPSLLFTTILLILSTLPTTTFSKTILRLNTTVYPVLYEISIFLDRDYTESNRYKLNTTIIFQVTEPLNESFKLHCAFPYHDKINATLIDDNFFPRLTPVIIPLKVTYDRDNEMWELDWKENGYLLEVGLNYTVKFENIESEFRDDLNGFYRRDYVIDGEKQTILATNFKPTYARTVFPCFDEPSFKAKFFLLITRPECNEYLAMSNNYAQKPIILENATDTTEAIILEQFLNTTKMATYQFSIVVGKFSEVGHPTFRQKVYFMDYVAEDSIKFGLEHAGRITSDLQTYLGVLYFNTGINQLYHIVMPELATDMLENWGLISYRDDTFLVDEESSARHKQEVAQSISHQVAHMWFSSIVTIDWWDNLWLQEGFSQYFQYFVSGKITKDWEIHNQFITEEIQTALIEDETSIKGLSSEVTTTRELLLKFNQVTASKGACLIRMLEMLAGQREFQRTLKDYISKSMFESVSPSYLWMSFGNLSTPLPNNYDLKEIMEGWIYNSGFPIVTVTNYTINAVLTQKRFSLLGNENDKSKWIIPITFVTASNNTNYTTEQVHWFDPSYKNTVLERVFYHSDWIIVNVQQIGFYRVNYEKNLWFQLTKQLKSDKFGGIPATTRAQLVDDVLSLARISETSYENALSLTEYLINETEYYPWYSAYNGFSYLTRTFSKDEELNEEIRNYIGNLLSDRIKTTHFDSILKNSTHIDIHQIVLILDWTCELEFVGCTSEANALFTDYKISSMNLIDPNLRKIVYCSAIRNGDSTDWQYMWNKLGSTTTELEADNIRQSLGCSKDTKILSDYLSKTLQDNSGISQKYRYDVLKAVLNGNIQNYPIALNFFTKNFNEISKRYVGLNIIPNIIQTFANGLNEISEVRQLEDFVVVNQHNLDDTTLQVLSNTIVAAKKKINWSRSYRNDIREYFSMNSSHGHFSHLNICINFLGTILVFLYKKLCGH